MFAAARRPIFTSAPVLLLVASIASATAAQAQSLPPTTVFGLQSPSGHWLSAADSNGTLYLSANPTTGAWEQWQFQTQPETRQPVFVSFFGTTPVFSQTSPVDRTPRAIHSAPRVNFSSMSFMYAWDPQGQPGGGLQPDGFVGLTLEGGGRRWNLADVNGQLVLLDSAASPTPQRWKIVVAQAPAAGRSALKPAVNDQQALTPDTVFAFQSLSGHWLSADANGTLYASTNPSAGAWEQWQFQPKTAMLPATFVTFHGTAPAYRPTSSTDPTARLVHGDVNAVSRPMFIGPSWDVAAAPLSVATLTAGGWVTLLLSNGTDPASTLGDVNGRLVAQPTTSNVLSPWKVVVLTAPASGRSALKVDQRMPGGFSSMPIRGWFQGPMASPNGISTANLDPSTGALCVTVTGGTPWCATPPNPPGNYFGILQADGNFAIYRGNDPSNYFDSPVWTSGSGGGAGNFTLTLRDSGRLEITNPDGTLRWGSPRPALTAAAFNALQAKHALQEGAPVQFENQKAACPTATYTVPANIYLLRVGVAGSSGSTPDFVNDTGFRAPPGRGGRGMFINAYLPVTPGQVLYAAAASSRNQSATSPAPFGGGGLTPNTTGEGGGASFVSSKPPSTGDHSCVVDSNSLVLIAGGGGGGGWSSATSPTLAGGSGGDGGYPGQTAPGGAMSSGSGAGGGGGGGTQAAGGLMGGHSGTSLDPRTAGSYLRGGDIFTRNGQPIGGAGGAGLWGGGPGGSADASGPSYGGIGGGGGGGGGSSWVSSSVVGFTATASATTGFVQFVPISY
jgi:hypothetical protein